MRFALVATCLWFALALVVAELPAREAIRLATAPALSPDGATLAFAWRGDIWLVSSAGGVARPWSTHPGHDAQPHFSPDGTRIAFTSDRTGTRQVYLGHVSGGFATQVTFHSEGTSVEEWFPDGQSLLVQGERDHSFVEPQRLFRVNVTKARERSCCSTPPPTMRDLARWPEDTLHPRGSGLVAQGIPGERGQSDLALRYADRGVYQDGRPGSWRMQPALAARREGFLLCRRRRAAVSISGSAIWPPASSGS